MYLIAGNHSSYDKPAPKPPVTHPVPVVPPQPTTPTQPSSPTVTPPAQPTGPGPTGGGGTQVPCSSDTSPGYTVGLPNGGCPTGSSVSSSTSTTQVVHLNDMPYTGAPEYLFYINVFAIALLLLGLATLSYILMKGIFGGKNEPRG